MSDTSAYQLPQRGSHLNKGDEGSDNELWGDVYSTNKSHHQTSKEKSSQHSHQHKSQGFMNLRELGEGATSLSTAKPPMGGGLPSTSTHNLTFGVGGRTTHSAPSGSGSNLSQVDLKGGKDVLYTPPSKPIQEDLRTKPNAFRGVAKRGDKPKPTTVTSLYDLFERKIPTFPAPHMIGKEGEKNEEEVRSQTQKTPPFQTELGANAGGAKNGSTKRNGNLLCEAKNVRYIGATIHKSTLGTKHYVLIPESSPGCYNWFL